MLRVPSRSPLLLLLSLCGSVLANDFNNTDFAEQEIGVVLTPTRLKQAIRDVPASVTVIESATIRALGISSVADALRLVPGMAVGQGSGNDYRINYHGTNGMVPRRMQVLVDGMSVYHVGYAQIFWKQLGLSIDNISRIEVTRSPSSASYGANSFQAVINIITKDTSLTPGLYGEISQGDFGRQNVFVRYGDSAENRSYRIAYEHSEDDGFDSNVHGNDRRDFSNQDFGSFSLALSPNNDHSFEFHAGLLRTDNGAEFVEVNERSYPDYRYDQAFINLNYTWQARQNNSVKVHLSRFQSELKQHWESCYPSIAILPELRDLQLSNPGYVSAFLSGKLPKGGTIEDDLLLQALLTKTHELGDNAHKVVCSKNVNQNTSDGTTQIELIDTVVINDEFRLVSGIGAAENQFDSETYTNGYISSVRYSLFSNAEYRVNAFVFNLGAMLEKEEGDKSGFEYSPRLGVGYKIDSENTLKFVLSKGIRTPDILETNRNWNYFIRDFSDGSPDRYFYYSAKSHSSLESEKIISREIIHYLNVPSLGLIIDTKLFNEDLYDLISEKLQFFDYEPTNKGRVELTGVETEIRYNPSSSWEFGGSYAYLDSDTDDFYEETLYAQHSGSIYSIYKIDPCMSVGIAYFGSNNVGGYYFDRYLLSLTKQVKAGNRFMGEAQLSITHEPNDGGFIRSTKEKLVSNYDSDTFFSLKLALSY